MDTIIDFVLTLHEPPKAGEPVISHWDHWDFFEASVKSRQCGEADFDDGADTYRVAFADGDTSHVVQPYHLVTPDRMPEPEELAVGSTVSSQHRPAYRASN